MGEGNTEINFDYRHDKKFFAKKLDELEDSAFEFTLYKKMQRILLGQIKGAFKVIDGNLYCLGIMHKTILNDKFDREEKAENIGRIINNIVNEKDPLILKSRLNDLKNLNLIDKEFCERILEKIKFIYFNLGIPFPVLEKKETHVRHFNEVVLECQKINPFIKIISNRDKTYNISYNGTVLDIKLRNLDGVINVAGLINSFVENYGDGFTFKINDGTELFAVKGKTLKQVFDFEKFAIYRNYYPGNNSGKDMKHTFNINQKSLLVFCSFLNNIININGMQKEQTYMAYN